MFFAVMRVFVADAVAKFFGARIVAVTQMFRHGERASGAHIGQRGVNRQISTVALVCRGNINRRFRQWNPCFRPADKLRRLKRRVCQHQRHRVGEADIFGGTNHDAPRDEARVFAGMNHFCQPVKRGVGIAATHRFDECGNRVVMGVAITVIHHGFFLDTLLRDRQRDADKAIGIRCRRERGDFQRVERLARVAIGNSG